MSEEYAGKHRWYPGSDQWRVRLEMSNLIFRSKPYNDPVKPVTLTSHRAPETCVHGETRAHFYSFQTSYCQDEYTMTTMCSGPPRSSEDYEDAWPFDNT